jgi:hypothetical protein
VDVSLCTKTTDENKAEQYICDLYKQLCLKKPDITWFDNQVKMYSQTKRLKLKICDMIYDMIWDKIYSNFWSWNKIWSQVQDRMRNLLANNEKNKVFNQMWIKIYDKSYDLLDCEL